MSARSVVFLGTASQVPTRTRNHHALFLRWDEFGILFDPGEGTQRQMLLAGLSATQITHICITHFHGDHCLGLAGIIQRLSLDRVSHPVEVIYPASGQIYFDRLRHASVFHEMATLSPRPIQATQELSPICRLGDNTLFCTSLDHGLDCQGYRIQEDDSRRMLPDRLAAAGIRGPDIRRLQVQGQIDQVGRVISLADVSEPRPGQSFALVMDTRPCQGATLLSQGVDLLVSESTYLQSERQEAHERGHMTARCAAELAVTCGVRRLGLTHFSQRYLAVNSFREEAAAHHPDVFSAADLDTLDVPPRSS